MFLGLDVSVTLCASIAFTPAWTNLSTVSFCPLPLWMKLWTALDIISEREILTSGPVQSFSDNPG